MMHSGAHKTAESDGGLVDRQQRPSDGAVQRARDMAVLLAVAAVAILLVGLVSSILFGPSVTTAL